MALKKINYGSNIITSDRHYIRPRRISSYAYLLKILQSLNITKILDVGCNRKVQSRLLQSAGFDVTTVDFDPRWEPDIVASVTQLPLDSNSCQAAVCTQVLEHLPYSEFLAAVGELERVASDFVVISLPYFGRSLSATGYAPFLGDYGFVIPLQIRRPVHQYDGDHHWEINKKHYSLKKILKDLSDAGLNVKFARRNPANPYHIFFLIQCN